MSKQPARDVVTVRPGEQSDSTLLDWVIWAQSERRQVVVVARVGITGRASTCLAILVAALVPRVVTAHVVGDIFAANPRGVLVTEAFSAHVIGDLATVVAERLRGARVVVVVPECAAIVTWVER